MFGFYIDRQRIAVTCDRMDYALVNAAFTQKFLFFNAMRFGIQFKIKVMKDPDRFPEIRIRAVSEFRRKIP